MKYIYSFFICIIFILIVSSCADTKKKNPETSDNPSSTLPPLETTKNTDKEPQPEPSNIINLEIKNPPPEATPPPRNVSKRALFAHSPQKRTMATDYKIGSLQDLFQDQIEFLKATWNLKKFLDSLTKKQIEKDLLLSEMSEELERFFIYQIEREYLPTEYRIGKAYIDENQEIRINLRLFRETQGVSEGEVYLKKENGHWLISDIQISFSLLTEKYTKDNQTFMPSSYNWLLQE